jgi:drug/metabolite transporter (DMT)-like permease
VLCLTPDSLLVRLIEADPWSLLFWRGLLMSLGFSLFVLWKKIPLSELKGKGWLAAAFLGLSTTCFVFSLEHTHAANTLVIIATSPLIAAMISWLFLRETVPLATWLAILVATGGVVVSLLDGFGRGSLSGEIFALGSAVCMACHFTALRWWKSNYGPLAVWGAGFLVAAWTLPWAKPLSIPPDDVGWMLLLGGVVLPVAFGMMAVGPQYLPAPEVGLILLAETVLGPLWVWLFLSERPGEATLGGGVLVVLTLTVHSLYRRSSRRLPQPTSSSAPHKPA